MSTPSSTEGSGKRPLSRGPGQDPTPAKRLCIEALLNPTTSSSRLPGLQGVAQQSVTVPAPYQLQSFLVQPPLPIEQGLPVPEPATVPAPSRHPAQVPQRASPCPSHIYVVVEEAGGPYKDTGFGILQAYMNLEDAEEGLRGFAARHNFALDEWSQEWGNGDLLDVEASDSESRWCRLSVERVRLMPAVSVSRSGGRQRQG